MMAEDPRPALLNNTSLFGKPGRYPLPSNQTPLSLRAQGLPVRTGLCTPSSSSSTVDWEKSGYIARNDKPVASHPDSVVERRLQFSNHTTAWTARTRRNQLPQTHFCTSLRQKRLANLKSAAGRILRLSAASTFPAETVSRLTSGRQTRITTRRTRAPPFPGNGRPTMILTE